jgi:PAS domain S-box-containing protein
MPASPPQPSLRSYRSYLAAVTGGLVLLVGIALGAVIYTQNSASLRRTTSISLETTALRVDARVRQLLDAAELTTMSGVRRTENKTVSSAELLPLFRDVISAFEQRPELTYLGYALANTGEYGLLERRPDGSIFLRIYEGALGRNRSVRDFRWQAGDFVQAAVFNGDQYDPRTRPHYVAARAAQRPIWTEIYPFVSRFSTDSVDGTTFAYPVMALDGTLVGVWDASLDVRSLSDFMRQLRLETGGTPHLYARRGARLDPIANGEDRDAPTARTGGRRADTTLPGPTVEAMMRRLSSDGEGQRSIEDPAVPNAYVTTMSISEARLPVWVIAVTLPRAIIDEPLRQLGRRLLLTTLAILLSALWLSRIVAARLARPLEALGDAATALALGKPIPAESTGSRLTEVAQLGASFTEMATAVAAREADLRASNQRLLSHFENTPLGVIEWDKEFRITAWNPAAEAIFGWARADMLGQPGTRFVPESERRAVYEACVGVLVSAEPTREIFEHVTQRGDRIDCEWYATPTTDAAGDVTGMISLVLDVTQRLRAEAAFRQAEERFDRLFRAAPAAIGLSRASDGTFIDVNDVAIRMFGYSRDELIGQSGRALNVFANLVEQTLALEPLQSGQGVYNRMSLFRARSGRLLTALFSAVPVFVGDEACVLWLCVDITARERAQQELLASQALKTAIVDASQDGVIACDFESRIVEWNASATLLLGWDRSDAIGRMVADVLQPADPGDVLMPYDTLQATSAPARREVRLLRRDGSVVDAELSVIVTTTDERSQRTYAVRDIAARRELGRKREALQLDLERRVRERTAELTRSNAQLIEANELKNRFLASVSHELRTPLTAILGFSELLRDPVAGVHDPAHVHQVTQMHDAAADLLRLINDLLDLSRVESGRIAVQREATDVRAVVEGTASLLSAEAQRKGLRLETSIDPWVKGIRIVSDPNRIRQVLLNLVSNAIKFTDAGVVSIAATRPENGGVTIAVSDTGRGIAPSDLDELFKPFASLAPDASAIAPGAGLGLYLTRSLLRLLGGRVEVRSQLGEGSVFTVWLPDSSPAVSGDITLLSLAS